MYVTDFAFAYAKNWGISERTFFITTVTAQRRPIFRRPETANLLIETLQHYR
jgi:hypothetical protein